VPTLKGYIDVDANTTHTVVKVPCNTRAKLCVLHRAENQEVAASKRAVLDGTVLVGGTSVVIEQMHICVKNVGCGANDAARSLTLI
jgi:hypothetical protein